VPEQFKTPKKHRNSEIAEQEREIAGAAIFHASFHTVLTQFRPVDPFSTRNSEVDPFFISKRDSFLFYSVLPTWKLQLNVQLF
jgi:hypothetical protein